MAYAQNLASATRTPMATMADFIAFAQNAEYLGGMGHRQAALDDSRLLPLSEWNVGA
jgi:hypothetical protein